MRIIDSNKDYYDFYQNIYRDNTFTFDRRDSFILSRSKFASWFPEQNLHSFDWSKGYRMAKRDGVGKQAAALLQVNHTFWLLRVTCTEYDKTWDRCLDYKLDLLSKWTDYNSSSNLLCLSYIRFPYYIADAEFWVAAAKAKEFNYWHSFDCVKVDAAGDKREERHIPILKDMGIPALIDPLEIYLALEEYFSEKVTANERSEAIGTTNDDKITMHGFDTVTSFRGKIKEN